MGNYNLLEDIFEAAGAEGIGDPEERYREPTTLRVKRAGAEGIEPPVRVLETRGLPLTDAPKIISKLSYYTANKGNSRQNSVFQENILL